MTDNRRKLIANPQGGLMKSFVKQLKLLGKLMGDSRVSPFVKVLPIAALAYLISPVDLAPGVVFPVIGALDDAAIMWIGTTLFVQLCPDNIVKEHMEELDMIDGDTDDVVDAESRDINDR
jgi:uncharacterized membrane protein YkvA (DUF1232 family)